MGEKDISEKILMDYNDVFADIMNGFLFNGEQVIKPDQLVDMQTHSQFKADGQSLHEEERDVAKLWKNKNIEIAIFGIENQTRIDKKMPLRVISYDGAAYKKQLLNSKKVIPVITIILYFGESRWNAPKKLIDLFEGEIPEDLTEFINDYKINVFEVAWLTDEEINRFTSDFRIVANFFANKRRDKNYIPKDTQEIRHVDEILKLLSVVSGERRYEAIPTDKEEVHNMCEVYDRVFNNGVAQGIAQGITQGIEQGVSQGQNKLITAITAIRKGLTDEEILASGIDQHTLDLAKTVR